MQTITITHPRTGAITGGVNKITLPRPPWRAEADQPAATQRPADDPARKTIVRAPVRLPEAVRFDAMAFTPEEMHKAVKAEQATHSFKSRWNGTHTNTAGGRDVCAMTAAFEADIHAAIDQERTATEVARLVRRSVQAVSHVLAGMVRDGRATRTQLGDLYKVAATFRRVGE